MLKSRVQSLVADPLQLVFLILDLLLLPAEIYLHLTTNTLHVMVALSACLIFPLFVLLLGRFGMWIFFFVYANVSALTIIYRDFTSLFILIGCVIFIPKLNKKRMIFIAALYCIDIFIVATLHDKDPIYIYIHFLVAAAFAFAFYVKNKSMRKLSLLPDEEKILDQLLEGKAQKNIDGFSENTVGKKLKNARLRNGIPDNKELLIIYAKNKNHQCTDHSCNDNTQY